MSTRVDVEEIQTTKSEKLLAAVLAVFVLIGGVWTYEKIDDYTADAIEIDYRGSSADRAARFRLEQAELRSDRAAGVEETARERLELSREAYRTELDAGNPAPALRRAYGHAQSRVARAEREALAAEEAVSAARPAAEEADSRIAREIESKQDRRDLLTFVLRFAFVASLIVFGYWLLARLRRRGSRYYPLAGAVVVVGSILAFVLAADYVTDYVDPLDLGPLVLALFGIAVTLLAFIALQRYLARRIPSRRARKGECPFCGYPVRGNEFCEGCGRAVVAACARCDKRRRVGVARCGACGAT
jgi:flagellar biogenesis protein FliO